MTNKYAEQKFLGDTKMSRIKRTDELNDDEFHCTW